MNDLEKTIQGLKKNQSGDPSVIINELFKPDVVGQDLALGLIDLLNGIKA